MKDPNQQPIIDHSKPFTSEVALGVLTKLLTLTDLTHTQVAELLNEASVPSELKMILYVAYYSYIADINKNDVPQIEAETYFIHGVFSSFTFMGIARHVVENNYPWGTTPTHIDPSVAATGHDNLATFVAADTMVLEAKNIANYFQLGKYSTNPLVEEEYKEVNRHRLHLLSNFIVRPEIIEILALHHTIRSLTTQLFTAAAKAFMERNKALDFQNLDDIYEHLTAIYAFAIYKYCEALSPDMLAVWDARLLSKFESHTAPSGMPRMYTRQSMSGICNWQELGNLTTIAREVASSTRLPLANVSAEFQEALAKEFMDELGLIETNLRPFLLKLDPWLTIKDNRAAGKLADVNFNKYYRLARYNHECTAHAGLDMITAFLHLKFKEAAAEA